jgi:hypothetical protein
MKTKQRGRLNICICGLFSALIMCLNTAQANEYGIGLVRLPDGFAAKNILVGTSSGEEDKELEIEWQIINEDVYTDPINVTTTLQRGDRSYVYKQSEKFSDDTTPMLTSFAGVYQPDNSKLAIAYKIDRVSTGDGRYSWTFTFTEPFDPSTPEGFKRLSSNPFLPGDGFAKNQTTTLMRARVDYKFPTAEKDAKDQAKTGLAVPKIPKTLYTASIDPSKQPNPDSLKLDSMFKTKNIQNIRDLNTVIIDIGRSSKMSNSTINYCVFDINNDPKIKKPVLRYLYWVEFDTSLEMPFIAKYNTYQEALTIPLFDIFNFKKNDKLMFGLSAQNTEFTLERPKRKLLSDEIKVLNKLEMPKDIQDLPAYKFEKPSIWVASTGINKGIPLNFEPYVLCHTWRSQITSARSPSTSDDQAIAPQSAKAFWQELSGVNDQKNGN